VLFISGAVVWLQLHSIAEDWVAAGSVPRDARWFEAQDAAALGGVLSGSALVLLLLSFLSFIAVIVRGGAVPRALAIPAAVGVVTFVWAIGSIGAAGWRVSMVGVLAVAASFVLTAGWLTLRGTRRPSQKALTSPADELPGEDIE